MLLEWWRNAHEIWLCLVRSHCKGAICRVWSQALGKKKTNMQNAKSHPYHILRFKWHMQINISQREIYITSLIPKTKPYDKLFLKYFYSLPHRSPTQMPIQISSPKKLMGGQECLGCIHPSCTSLCGKWLFGKTHWDICNKHVFKVESFKSINIYVLYVRLYLGGVYSRRIYVYPRKVWVTIWWIGILKHPNCKMLKPITWYSRCCVWSVHFIKTDLEEDLLWWNFGCWWVQGC